MKTILLKDYNNTMGEFIDVNYNDQKVVSGAKHIMYDNLLVNHSELLDKKKKYFIYCNGGMKSKRVVQILEIYGYDVTLVIKS